MGKITRNDCKSDINTLLDLTEFKDLIINSFEIKLEGNTLQNI